MMWCGYMDVLGSREAAKRGPAELVTMLHRLHSALSTNFRYFVDARCSAFSDGAFFKTDKFANFYPFYSRVRNQLYQARVFVRASYIPGDIDFFDRESDEEGRYLNPTVPKFRSFTFGRDAPQAYQAESELKGVGVTISSSWSSEDHDDKVLPTFGVRLSGRKVVPFSFYDYRFSSFEIEDEETGGAPEYDGQLRLMDSIIAASHAAVVEGSSIGAYYLPILVLAVRSADYKTLRVEKSRITCGPYVFRRLFGANSAYNAVKDVPGLHLLMLSVYDKVFRDFSEKVPIDVQEIIVRRMMLKPSCFRELASVPPYVISPLARHELIRARARLENVSN